MSVTELARPDILALTPYSSARGEADAGGMVLLNANESPWAASVDRGLGLNRYPDPQPAALIAALVDNYGVAPAQVLATAGSDAGIDLIVRAFCRAGRDAIVHHPPTFGMFAVSAAIQGAVVLDQPLGPDYELDFDALAERVERAGDTPVKVVFLCSPNNPTGNAIAPALIAELCKRLAGRALVVVDEAYAEFSTIPGVVPLLNDFEHLAVLRTLSKAHALAGLRLGCVLAHRLVIDLLRRIMPPYPLSVPTVAAAIEELAPDNRPRVAARVAALRAARERLTAQLGAYPFVQRVFPSEANFVLVRVDDAAALTRFCRERKVLIRHFGDRAGLDNCVRISVGAAPEMAHLNRVLDQYR